MVANRIEGARFEVDIESKDYPEALLESRNPPKRLYVVGSLEAIASGLAIVGARKATPYGIGCAGRFSRIAAKRGITIISGGALGCDSAAHSGAIEEGGKTVAFLGGGIDELYPKRNLPLFQRIVDSGGAVVSEHEWGVPPLRYMFRERNRLIAGLAKATLIVEAGLPSGTFSTADEALSCGHDVLAVPGAITSATSRGANRLIYQGATPIIDDDSFQDQITAIFGLPPFELTGGTDAQSAFDDGCAGSKLAAALSSTPMTLDEMISIIEGREDVESPLSYLMVWIANMERKGVVSKYPDGRYGVTMRSG